MDSGIQSTEARLFRPMSADISALKSEYDAIVIGAGPAGSAAAYAIARDGASVLLVEKALFPRDKVCGCCLSPKSMRIIESLDLSEMLTTSGGTVLSTLQLYVRGQQVELSLLGGLSLSRASLDSFMVVAAKKVGVSFVHNTKAIIGEVTDIHRHVILEQSGCVRNLRAKVVVAAWGLNRHAQSGPLQDHIAGGSKIGLGTILASHPKSIEPGTIYMACDRHGYVGFVGIEGNRVDVAAAVDPAFVKVSGGAAEAVTSIMRSAGLAQMEGLTQAVWVGTLPITRKLVSPAAERLFVVGDAAGYTEPFTGEGIAWALSSGAAVAPFAIKAITSWNQKLICDWVAFYRRLIVNQQWPSRMISSVFTNPLLSELAVWTISGMPAVATPFVNYINAV
jgi:flavin-dependent dehydrogenase